MPKMKRIKKSEEANWIERVEWFIEYGQTKMYIMKVGKATSEKKKLKNYENTGNIYMVAGWNRSLSSKPTTFQNENAHIESTTADRESRERIKEATRFISFNAEILLHRTNVEHANH